MHGDRVMPAILSQYVTPESEFSICHSQEDLAEYFEDCETLSDWIIALMDYSREYACLCITPGYDSLEVLSSVWDNGIDCFGDPIDGCDIDSYTFLTEKRLQEVKQ